MRGKLVDVPVVRVAIVVLVLVIVGRVLHLPLGFRVRERQHERRRPSLPAPRLAPITLHARRRRLAIPSHPRLAALGRSVRLVAFARERLRSLGSSSLAVG